MSGAELTRPHVFEPGAPISGWVERLLMLHGTGADEFDLLNLGKAIDPDGESFCHLVGLVDENGMNRFFVRYPDGSFDENSIKENVDELACLCSRKASVHYGFRSRKSRCSWFLKRRQHSWSLLQLCTQTPCRR
jgi:phospholipase/carboxylesterase